MFQYIRFLCILTFKYGVRVAYYKENNEMTQHHTTHHTFQSEKKTKADRIRHLKRNNPKITASEIAKIVPTSVSYVENVLSTAKQSGEVKRRREERLYAVLHGSMFYRDEVMSEWYEELEAPIVNGKTGMKQVGFKERGDPCSCQIHKNGGVVVFPHASDWREWLCDTLTKLGWDFGKSSLLVDNLVLQVVLAEGGVRIPDGYFPESFHLETHWGVLVVRDNSPTKNMLELKLSVPDLDRYLGLPEIKMQMDLLHKGSMTNNQLLRRNTALLLQLASKLAQWRNDFESAKKA